MKRFSILIILGFLSFTTLLSAQPPLKVFNDWMTRYEVLYPMVGRLRVTDVQVNSRTKRVGIYGNANMQYLPFRDELVSQMLHELDSLLGPDYKNYKVALYANGVDVNDLIPNYYREQPDHKRLAKGGHKVAPFRTNVSQPYQLTQGLENRHIALWHSHGWYYDQKSDRWRWQRARLFETVEDKLTLSFVLPYLLPMLEQAGAYVWLPRERDVQVHEVIVDNDGSTHGSTYKERGSLLNFAQGGHAGFGYKRESYIECQNPFTEGTYRVMRGHKEADAQIEWVPDIPERGAYAVSIAYESLPHSTEQAHYTVNHLGGSTEVHINQTMGAGTWVYLGTFDFDKGKDRSQGSVVLTNEVEQSGSVVVADVVRFGGGMGNVARRPAVDSINSTQATVKKRRSKLVSIFPKDEYELSGRPRYLEGARYWMQWAGVPDSVYSFSQGVNDYVDDYAGRGPWVNWLARGSYMIPDSVGLNVPIELSLGFHTDASFKENVIVGTLGIYTSDSGDKRLKETFPNGQSRQTSRDLTDLVTSSIVNDVRKLYRADWSFRGMWNKNYAESRTPEVPATLLELLSHQNFEDMLYGLDPNFRFTVSRAIYKGILRFVATQHQQPYVVQPLPVSHMSAQFEADSVVLRWHAVLDSLEPTAAPTGYVVYSRRDGGGFDNGIYLTDTVAHLSLEPNVLMSYRVVAVNEGGASMPSETLSVCRATESKGVVLVVNGFTRVGAPQGFWAGAYGGFPSWLDRGVPYATNLSYVGNQYEFDKRLSWTDDDAPGFGASYADHETMKVMGNSFDFPSVHGASIVEAGYSFVSSSVAAVEDGMVDLQHYRLVDLILGEQRESVVGRDSLHWQYKTFSLNLQRQVGQYCQAGGALLVTGAYVGSDLCNKPRASNAQIKFANEVLHLSCRTMNASRGGEAQWAYSPIFKEKGKTRFATELNDTVNAVCSVDGLEPCGKGAYTVMRYTDNNIGAAVGYHGSYAVLVMGYPFESIIKPKERNRLMHQMLNFLTMPTATK